MRFVLAFLVIVNGTFLFASEEDTTFDANYRLYDVQSHKTVDTNVRLKLVEPEDLVTWEDEWVTGPLNDGAGGIGSNYDSIHNVNPKVAGFISVCFLSFIAYIIFRVRRGLKKEERRRKN